jgi:CDP-glycerol glycerophosphotransferase (TagB/SpsB family)
MNIERIVKKAKRSRRKICKLPGRFSLALHKEGLTGTIGKAVSKAGWKLLGRRLTDYEMRHPRPVLKNKLVFDSYGDYGDNARALCEYMLQQEYYSGFEFVWLIDNPKRYRGTLSPRIRAVRRKALWDNRISLKAIREVHSAQYVFYTVNVNWAKVAQKDQVFVNLWHGCSFKDNKGNRRIFFDYYLVTSPFFRDLKAKYWNIPEYDLYKILPLGYPRYDVMKAGSEKARNLVTELKAKRGCSQAVIWMPTFRRSDSKRLNEHSLDNSVFNLPIVLSNEDLIHADKACAQANVLLILKKHRLHRMGTVDTESLTNIIYIDDEWLEDRNVQLYDFLHETDAMITDYSSVGIDYLLLDRPIGFTLDDFESYRESRGFTVDNPLEYMPGKRIYNLSDFEDFIAETGQALDPYREERRAVTDKIHVKCDCYCQSLLEHLNLTKQ